MKILGIETSSPLFSICLNEDARLLYEIRRERSAETDSRDGHLLVEAQRLLKCLNKERLDAIAISIGPGMFTSLRVGLSLAKGLALTKNIGIVGVNTLDVIGAFFLFLEQPVLAVINAYHGEIYAARYEQGRRVSDYLLTTPAEIIKVLKGQTMSIEGKNKVFIAGPGIEVFKNLKVRFHNNNLDFINADFLLPSASRVVNLALSRITSGDFDDAEMLEPFYIKKTDAERNYNK